MCDHPGMPLVFVRKEISHSEWTVSPCEPSACHWCCLCYSSDGDTMLQGFGAFSAFPSPMPECPCALSPWFSCWFSPSAPSTAWLELLQALP